MENYRLYGDSRSGNCYKAALVLSLSGKPFEWIETDVMAQATRTPEFLAMNPNGKVPLLVSPGGRCLAESNAMLLHLSEGTRYLPSDAWTRALVYQWLFFEQYSHEPCIAVARFIMHIARRGEEERDRLAGLLEKGHMALAVMEQTLADQPFLTGPDFTVADIALYAYTHVAEEGGFILAGYPAVRHWLRDVAGQAGHLSMNEACR